jgi:hypothetical protein
MFEDVSEEDVAVAAATADVGAAVAGNDTAIEVDGRGTEEGTQQQLQQQSQSQVAVVNGQSQPSGPDPSGSPYGATAMPMLLPSLLQLAAAAAKATAAEEVELAVKPVNIGSSTAASPFQSSATTPSNPVIADDSQDGSAAATATIATAVSSTPVAAATAKSPRSATSQSGAVLQLAQAVYDVFSCPGFLLAVLQQQQQQQQQEKLLQPFTASNFAAAIPSTATAVASSGASGGSSSGSGQLPDHGFDLTGVQRLYSAVLRSYAPEAVAALGSAVARMLQELPNSREWSSGSSLDVVRLVFVLLQVSRV